MKFIPKSKKVDKEALTKNHSHAIKYRKRKQEDVEKHKELTDYLKHADQSLQDPLR